MQKLNLQGRLVLGLIATMASAAPLACGDDDSKGAGPGANAGASGTAGSGGRSAQGGGAGTSGSAQGGGAGTSGSAQGGGAGTSGSAHGGEVGVGGGGGTNMGGGNMGGGAGMIDNGMAGEAGMAGGPPVDEAAQYQAQLDAICTVEGSLDCSQTAMPASDKQACLDSFAGLLDFAPNCVPQIRAFVSCLTPQPAASYSCTDGAAYPKDSVCADESAAFNACLSQ